MVVIIIIKKEKNKTASQIKHRSVNGQKNLGKVDKNERKI